MVRDTKLVLNTLGLVVCGIILGCVMAACYYVPAYDDMKDQRNTYRTDSREAIITLERSQSEIDSLNSKLRIKTIEYGELNTEYRNLNTDYNNNVRLLESKQDSINSLQTSYNQLDNKHLSLISDYNDQTTVLTDVKELSVQQKQQLDSVSGLMQDSYNRGYNDGSTGDSNGIGDLLELLIWFI